MTQLDLQVLCKNGSLPMHNGLSSYPAYAKISGPLQLSELQSPKSRRSPISRFQSIMSGAEVLGLISSIVAIIDASLEVYRVAKDASGLPLAFRDVASRLPMIKITLRNAFASLYQDRAFHDRADDWVETMRTSLEMCKAKLEELDSIFRKALPPSHKSTLGKMFKAVKMISKSERVLYLKNGIMEDLQVLTANRAVRAATYAQVEELAGNLDRGKLNKNIGSSVLRFWNTGDGIQTVHSGIGDMHTSVEPLFSGVFHAPVNYTRYD